MNQDVILAADNRPQSAELRNSNDEINLTDLVLSLWRQRGLIVATSLLMALVVLAFHFSKSTFSSPKSIEYPISLTFLGSSSKYPNGTVFSIRDIIAPSVLQAVVTSKKANISAERLGDAIDIQYSNSLLVMTEERLANLLNNTKTPEDIRAVATNELKAMRHKTIGFATLRLDLSKTDLTEREGIELIRATVEAWAALSIERGLMNVDINRPTTAFAVTSKSNLIDIYDSADSYLKAIQRAISELGRLSGASSLVIDGFTLSDLRREAQMLADSDVGPLRKYAYANAGELSQIDRGVEIRLYARQRLLNLERERLLKLITAYDESLVLINKGSSRDVSSSNMGQASGAQIDQSFLNSMLDIGNKLGSVELRQDLFSRRNAAMEELLNLEKEIAILDSANSGEFVANNSRSVLEVALDDIEIRLNNLREKIGAFIDSYRIQTLQNNNRLYHVDSEPLVRGGYATVISKIGMYVVLGLMLGGMIGILIALIRSATLSRNT